MKGFCNPVLGGSCHELRNVEPLVKSRYKQGQVSGVLPGVCFCNKAVVRGHPLVQMVRPVKMHSVFQNIVVLQ